MTDFDDDKTLSFRVPTLGQPERPESDITSLGNLVALQADITKEQVQEAIALQKQHPGMKLGEALVQLGYLTEDQVRLVCQDQNALREAKPSDQRAEAVMRAADKAQEHASTLDITMDLYLGWIDQIANKIADKLGKK